MFLVDLGVGVELEPTVPTATYLEASFRRCLRFGTFFRWFRFHLPNPQEAALWRLQSTLKELVGTEARELSLRVWMS